MEEDSFTYFNSDKTDDIKLNDEIINNYFFNKLNKDKDFDILFSSSIIHIYWHNFDNKEFELNIPSTKLVDKKDIDNQMLEYIEIIDVIYSLMWLEKIIPNYRINLSNVPYVDKNQNK